MMIEFLNGLANDISPFYFYVSILLTIVCSYQLLSIDLKCNAGNNNVFIRKYHAIKVRLLPMQELYGKITGIHDWITKKTKRKASPDDDTDHPSFSITTRFLYIRGGQTCKIIYSLSSGNTVLLV
jgi:hypothetical protein